jgi:hypothetical protein
MEKIKRDDDRVDIAKLDNDDTEGDSLTGGYLLKSDWAEWGEGWESSYSGTGEYGYGSAQIIWEDPNPDELNWQQKEYIENYITEFEQTLKSKNFRDPEQGYYPYIDIDSFIDFMIGQELANNVDAYALSTFFYKKRDSNGGKLHAGPLWDFNFSFGNADYGGSQYTSTYSFDTYLDPAPMWWLRFLEDSVFTQRMTERWSSLRDSSLTNERIFFIIDSLSILLQEAQSRNFKRWDILGEYIWPNYFVADTFEEEIDYMKDWLDRRLSFLDRDIPRLSQKYNIEDTGEEDEEESVIIENTISIFPNPSNSITNIAFTQSRNGPVQINIYNVLGQKISRILIPFSDRGDHSVQWAGRDFDNNKLSPGVYFAIVRINFEVVFRRKLVIIK